MSTATSFVCPECQRVLKTASPVAPGKKIRCPECGTVFAPAASASAAPARAASPIRRADDRNGRPVSRGGWDDRDDTRGDDRGAIRRRRSLAEDDDYDRGLSCRGRDDDRDDDDWDAPRRPRRKKGSGMLLILGGSGVLLLLAAFVVSAFVWPGFLRSGGSNGKATEDLEALLAFVPPDHARVLFCMDLSDVKERNDLERAFLKAMKNSKNEEGNLGVKVPDALTRDVQTAVVAMNPTNSQTAMLAFRTKSAFDEAKVRKDFAADQGKKIGGKTVYRVPGRFAQYYLALPDQRTVVLSSLSEDAFAKALAGAHSLPAEHSEIKKLAGSSQFWAVVSLNGLNDRGNDIQTQLSRLNFLLGKQAPALAGAMKAAQRARAVGFWLRSDTTVSISVAVACSNSADAGEIHAAVRDYWDQSGKTMIRGFREVAKMGGPNAPMVGALLDDVDNSFRVDISGAVAYASITLSGPSLQHVGRAMEDAIAKVGRNDFQPPVDKNGKDKIFPPKDGFPKDGFPPPNQGKVILRTVGSLAAGDPSYKNRPNCRHKLHVVKMTAGRRYQIDLKSAWDNYLYLEDPRGLILAWDDDGGGYPNARIRFTAPQTGDYRIIATSCRGNTVGAYTLEVRESMP